MQWLRADLHVHSLLSPCAAVEMTPRNIIRNAVAAGVDIVAITDHPDALGQRRLDPGLHELHPGGIHQQQFSLNSQRFIVHFFHYATHFFCQRRTTGLAGSDYGAALGPKSVGQCLDVRGLARTIDAFKTDEQAGETHATDFRFIATGRAENG